MQTSVLSLFPLKSGGWFCGKNEQLWFINWNGKQVQIAFNKLFLARPLKAPVIIPSSDVFSYLGEKKKKIVGDSVSSSEVMQSRITGCHNKPICLNALDVHQLYV